MSEFDRFLESRRVGPPQVTEAVEGLKELLTAAIKEEGEAAVKYARMATVALELGFDEMAKKLSDISLDQATHELTLKDIRKELK